MKRSSKNSKMKTSCLRDELGHVKSISDYEPILATVIAEILINGTSRS